MQTKSRREKKKNEKLEFVYREARSRVFIEGESENKSAPVYPWHGQYSGGYPRITKEYFQCKGSAINPVCVQEENHYLDCSGRISHTLPVRDGGEEIYPILLTLLNHVQEKSGKRVVVTCGHRCPQHNTYADPCVFNQTSKHMIGAEVDFYVEGLEQEPEKIVDWILSYYDKDQPSHYRNFQRYSKIDTNVVTSPWYNKEIFIKLYNPDEGRDLDNDHPFPYVSIQVRFDREREKSVVYSWPEAHRGYGHQ